MAIRLVTLLAAVCLSPACGNPRAESTPAPAATVSSADASVPGALGTATLPHGNHDPKYGGVVLMNGDLHFEVVLRPDGHHRVYFSDATRSELPASVASRVSIAVSSKGKSTDIVDLEIDEAGESWIASGTPVTDPDATARITYAIRGEPYWIDVPFSAVPARR